MTGRAGGCAHKDRNQRNCLEQMHGIASQKNAHASHNMLRNSNDLQNM
jgi:hypothetical protein